MVEEVEARDVAAIGRLRAVYATDRERQDWLARVARQALLEGGDVGALPALGWHAALARFWRRGERLCGEYIERVG